MQTACPHHLPEHKGQRLTHQAHTPKIPPHYYLLAELQQFKQLRQQIFFKNPTSPRSILTHKPSKEWQRWGKQGLVRQYKHAAESPYLCQPTHKGRGTQSLVTVQCCSCRVSFGCWWPRRGWVCLVPRAVAALWSQHWVCWWHCSSWSCSCSGGSGSGASLGICDCHHPTAAPCREMGQGPSSGLGSGSELSYPSPAPALSSLCAAPAVLHSSWCCSHSLPWAGHIFLYYTHFEQSSPRSNTLSWMLQVALGHSWILQGSGSSLPSGCQHSLADVAVCAAAISFHVGFGLSALLGKTSWELLLPPCQTLWGAGLGEDTQWTWKSSREEFLKAEGHISPLGQKVFHCPDQEFGCSHK